MKNKFSMAFSLAMIIAMLLTSLALADAATDQSININGGAADTTSLSVTINVSARHCPPGGDMKALEVAFSNISSSGPWTVIHTGGTDWPGTDTDGCTVSGAGIPANFAWTLASGAGGTRTVYARFKHGPDEVFAQDNINFISNTPPSITVNDVTKEGNTTGGWTLAFVDIGSASDAEDGTPSVSCSPAIGSVLPLGANSVSCTATDSGGLTATDSGTVTVVDTTAPTLNLPANQQYEGNTTGGYNGAYTGATASDIVDASPTVACTPASGTLLALGANTINCTATDDSSNSSSGSFTVTVVDTTAPSITCPANISGTVGQVVVLGSPTVSDIVDASPTVSNNAPGSFGPGTTTVIWTATDDSGNSATCSQTVTLTYNFAGFFQPVDNNIMNLAKAGQAIPLKWRLTDANGNPVLNLTSVTVTVSSLSCASGTTPDLIEEYAAGSSGLQNLGNGYYQWNWKTPTNYASSCKTLNLNLGDGVAHTAQFQFKR